MNDTHVSCPARIDLAGGTLDIAPLSFIVDNAQTINLAINWRTHVQLTEEKQFLVTKDEQIVPQAETQPLFQAALDFYKPQKPLGIHIRSDIPQAAGLGGSSVLLTALCQALALAQGHALDDRTLLQHVTLLEHKLLMKPAGIQDAYAAIKGGLNYLDFSKGDAHHEPMVVPQFLRRKLTLLYSSQQHHSGINNWKIIKHACEGDDDLLHLLKLLADNAGCVKQSLIEGNLDQFTRYLRVEASLRAKLEKDIVPSPMQTFCEKAGDGVVGKICGAGGGGCMLLFGDLPSKQTLDEIAEPLNLSIFEASYTERGVFLH